MGSVDENWEAAFLWRKKWRTIGIWQQYFETQFVDAPRMKFEVMNHKGGGKNRLNKFLTPASLNRIFGTVQSALYPIPAYNFIPKGSAP